MVFVASDGFPILVPLTQLSRLTKLPPDSKHTPTDKRSTLKHTPTQYTARFPCIATLLLPFISQHAAVFVFTAMSDAQPPDHISRLGGV